LNFKYQSKPDNGNLFQWIPTLTCIPLECILLSNYQQGRSDGTRLAQGWSTIASFHTRLTIRLHSGAFGLPVARPDSHGNCLLF